MNRSSLSRDLDHCVIGKIELSSQMTAIYLQTLLKLIEDLEYELNALKNNEVTNGTK